MVSLFKSLSADSRSFWFKSTFFFSAWRKMFFRNSS